MSQPEEVLLTLEQQQRAQALFVARDVCGDVLHENLIEVAQWIITGRQRLTDPGTLMLPNTLTFNTNEVAYAGYPVGRRGDIAYSTDTEDGENR